MKSKLLGTCDRSTDHCYAERQHLPKDVLHLQYPLVLKQFASVDSITVSVLAKFFLSEQRKKFGYQTLGLPT